MWKIDLFLLLSLYPVIRNDVRKVLGDNGESIYGFDKFVEFNPEYKNGKITLYSIDYQIVLITSYPKINV